MADLNPQSLVASSAITDPVALATSIASNSWDDWSKNLSPYLQTQVQGANNVTNRLADGNIAQAGATSNLANSMASDYTKNFAPAGAKMAGMVNEMGTDAYKTQQRGKAMADVQGQISNQTAQNQRNMSRMGVNPSSGRALAMSNQSAIQGAAAMAGAANQSDANVRSQYISGLQGLSGLGLDTMKASSLATGDAQKWSALGLDAAMAAPKLSIDYGNLASNAAKSAGLVASTAAETRNKNDTTNANIQNIKDSNSIPNLLLSGVVKAGSGALNGAADSAVKWATGGISNYFNKPEPLVPYTPEYTQEPIDYSLGSATPAPSDNIYELEMPQDDYSAYFNNPD